jgi:hypothetical protein
VTNEVIGEEVTAVDEMRNVIFTSLGLGALVGGLVGFRIGTIVGGIRAGLSSYRTVRGRKKK